MMFPRGTFVVLVFIIFSEKLCTAESCDQLGVLVYEDIACKPVKTEGNKCPTKYDCNFAAPKSGCIFKGRSLGAREEIESNLTYSGCSVGCRCDDLNSIICAILDCPEHLHYSLQTGCYYKYELGDCCSSGQICNSTQTKKCEVDGKAYEVGQKFYPQNTCYSCVCHENFNGEFDEKTCIKRNCNSQIHYGSELTQNCAPAYFKYNSEDVLCCPDHFVCPESSDNIEVVNSNADKDLECSYGEKKLKLGEGLKRKVYKYGKDRNLQCECVLPPLLTCKEI